MHDLKEKRLFKPKAWKFAQRTDCLSRFIILLSADEALQSRLLAKKSKTQIRM